MWGNTEYSYETVGYVIFAFSGTLQGTKGKSQSSTVNYSFVTDVLSINISRRKTAVLIGVKRNIILRNKKIIIISTKA